MRKIVMVLVLMLAGCGSTMTATARPTTLASTTVPVEDPLMLELREACSRTVPYRITRTRSGMEVRCFAGRE